MTSPLTILVADDDKSILQTLLLTLKSLKYKAIGTESAEEALKILQEKSFDVLLTDMRMTGLSGVDLIRETQALYPDTISIIMTAFASYENAVSAIKAGAFDYLPKPFTSEQLEHLMHKVSTLVELRRENIQLKTAQEKKVESIDWFDGLTSKASLQLQALVEKIAPSDVSVLLTGETGSGKTALAQTIHQRSQRAEKAFITVMCNSLVEQLFESEVFGHVRGAFTGAVRDHAGKFELAEGGTLFLDEIGELSPTAQAKLLRFLEDRVIEKVGDNKPIHLDVRVIAATNQNLVQRVKEKLFREDLYYRLNMFECYIPPLRERPEDIAPLASRLFYHASKKYSDNIPTLSQPLMNALINYEWYGNVRELKNITERIALLASGREAALSDLPPSFSKNAQHQHIAENNPFVTLKELEKNHITQLLELGYSMDKTAEILGITTVTLWRKRKELELV